ncbi:13E12 repeat family protein [Aestuariimicrobium ganziense]|uniref:hypothetical protein n=1 Tax=Aestuariimicrobium ganziense TaxID=2773677 RepID=UPI001942BD6F|nr:hypothetical protein [Aestuariimicrobium ganziense]
MIDVAYERQVDERHRLAAALHQAGQLERRAQVDQVSLLLDLCDAHTLPTAGPDGDDLLEYAGERYLTGGSSGTPSISEYLCLIVGSELGIAPEQGALRIHRALDLRHRMPRLWAAVQRLEVRVWEADRLTSLTSHLSLDAALWVDRRLEARYPTAPIGRLVRLTKGLVVQADPALARERAQQERDARSVDVTPLPEFGVGMVNARLDLADALRLRATCDRLADELALAGDESTLPQRLAQALGMLADPATALAVLNGTDLPTHTSSPAATVVVHVSAESLGEPTDAVARVEGMGPVLVQQLGDLLRHHAKVRLQPVIDVAGMAPVEAYEVPDRMREAIVHRNPVDAFPYGRRSARSCDLDHTVPYQHSSGAPPGQTRPGNLAPLARRAHRGKTNAGWLVHQPVPGILLWTSPVGTEFLTGPFGTVRLPRSLPPAEPSSSPVEKRLRQALASVA